jgi:hypothetical protein
VQIVEALLDRDVVRLELGESPLKQDVVVDVDEFEVIVRTLCGKEDNNEKGS